MMTAIAGIMQDGKVYIGGDSAGVRDLSIENRIDPKVFRNGRFLIGYCDSFRMGQILQYEFSPPVQPERQTDLDFMIRSFVPAVRDCLKAHGFTPIADDDDSDFGGDFLVGYKGQLFNVQPDFHVGRSRMPFAALGCGSDLVLGSLHTTQRFDLTPRERIKLALEAAESFSAGVSKPFCIKSI